MWWIGIVCALIAIFLWGICAGKQRENDDEDQIQYMKEWYEKKKVK